MQRVHTNFINPAAKNTENTEGRRISCPPPPGYTENPLLPISRKAPQNTNNTSDQVTENTEENTEQNTKGALTAEEKAQISQVGQYIRRMVANSASQSQRPPPASSETVQDFTNYEDFGSQKIVLSQDQYFQDDDKRVQYDDTNNSNPNQNSGNLLYSALYSARYLDKFHIKNFLDAFNI